MTTDIEIPAAARTREFHYAIRNIVSHAKALEEEGRKVRYLNIGDPLIYDYETPGELVEALCRAVRENRNGYVPSLGIPEAREAIADYVSERGVKRATDDVVVTAGASEAADLLLTATIEPGEEVLTPVPSYPLYSAILAKLGACERRYRLRGEAGFAPDPDEIASLCSARTRAIVVIHPNNPTGAVYSNDILDAIVSVAERKRLLIIADEVYAELAFDGRPTPLAAIAAGRVPVVTLDSFSKSFLVPGWRLGWLWYSPHRALQGGIRSAVQKLCEGRLCGPGPVQYAIAAGLRGSRSHLPPLVDRMRTRSRVASDLLNAIEGVHCHPAGGAFYLMPRVPLKPGESDKDFVLAFLRASGNLVVHGSGFNMDASEGYFRLVTLPEEDALRAVIGDLECFLSERKQGG